MKVFSRNYVARRQRPLMFNRCLALILALVLVNSLQREGIQRRLKRHPGLSLLLTRLRGAPPRALGKSFHPD